MSRKDPAAVSLGKKGGAARKKQGGRKMYSEMAKKSWENRTEINPKTGKRSRKLSTS